MDRSASTSFETHLEPLSCPKLQSLSDDSLLRRLSELLQPSRRVESELVAHIGEVDRRRLYAREASSSMFRYCTEVLHLSEAEAYLRIAAARAARLHPVLLEMLGDGRLHLSGIAKLAPHLDELSPSRREALLARAAHKSKREIEELVAEIAPKPDVPGRMRKLPERGPAAVQGGDALQSELELGHLWGPRNPVAPDALATPPCAEAFMSGVRLLLFSSNSNILRVTENIRNDSGAFPCDPSGLHA